MNKKIAAISLLFMAFAGLQFAGAISTATISNPFTLHPASSWKKFDQGNKIFQNNPKDPLDDKKLNYTTYKSNSNNKVKIYGILYKKTSKTSSRWNINKYMIISLDKSNSKQIKINIKSYNTKKTLNSNTNINLKTTLNTVQFFSKHKDFLLNTCKGIEEKTYKSKKYIVFSFELVALGPHEVKCPVCGSKAYQVGSYYKSEPWYYYYHCKNCRLNIGEK